MSCLSAAFVLTLAAPGMAGPTALDELVTGPGFRIAAEVEILPRNLGTLLQFFDFNILRSRQVYPEWKDGFDNYLENDPSEFWKLPHYLRNRLSEGLVLPRNILLYSNDIDDRSSAMPVQTSIILADRNVIANRGPIAEEPRLIVRQRTAPAPMPEPQSGALEVPEYVRTQQTWAEINRRWRQLSLEEQARNADWNQLPKELKGRIFHKYAFPGRPRFSDDTFRMPLNINTPAEIRNLLYRFFWHQDRGAIEFKHKLEFTGSSPDRMLGDLYRLINLADPRIARKLDDPGDPMLRDFVWGSLHIHISRENRDIEPLARQLNYWLLFLRLHLGIVSDVNNEGQHLFSESVRSRGLLRLVGYDRFEIRTFPIPPAELLGFVVPLLFMDEEEALEQVRQATINLIDETVIRRIIDSGPNADNFLKLVESFIGRNALRASAPYQDHIQRISLAVEFERDPLARIKEEPFRSYVAEGDARFVSPYALAASRAALGSRGSTHIEWDTVLLGITKTSYLATKIDAVINLCYSQPPPQFWSVALDILTNDFALGSKLRRCIHSFNSDKSLLKEIESRLSANKREAVFSALTAVGFLEGQIADRLWSKILNLYLVEYQSTEWDPLKTRLLSIFRRFTRWPHFVWDKFEDILQSAHYSSDIKSATRELIDEIPDWQWPYDFFLKFGSVYRTPQHSNCETLVNLQPRATVEQ